MQLIENKRSNSFLIAEISAIRKFTRRFRAPRFGLGSVILSAAKPACRLYVARPAVKHLASTFRNAPSFATPAKCGIFQIADQYACKKLENLITLLSSITSKFLIDNLKRLSRTLCVSGAGNAMALAESICAHSSITTRQGPDSLAAPSFAAFAKGGVFPISKQHAAQELEFRLSALPSATSKFLIDNFLALLNSQSESPA